MLNIAVLGSTRGTDLQALLDAQTAGTLGGAKIALVISNRPDAPILQRAEDAGVEAVCIDSKDTSQADFEEQMVVLLKRREINLILLIGFMKILSAEFVKQYDHKILNIHPSLLPRFKGAHAIRDAYEAKVKETGVTVHVVTAEVDSGRVLLQKKVKISKRDTLSSLEKKIHKAEHEIYPLAIQKYILSLRTV